MKALVRQFFEDGTSRPTSELMEDLQLGLDLSPAESTLIIATLLADGVLARADPSGTSVADPASNGWLRQGPHFAEVCRAEP